MKTVMMAEAKAKLSALVDEVRTTETAIQIRRRKKPAAYLVRAEEFDRLLRIADTMRALQLRKALAGPTHELREVLEDLELTI